MKQNGIFHHSMKQNGIFRHGMKQNGIFRRRSTQNYVANYGTNDYRKNSSNSVRGQARSYSYQIQGQVKRG